MRMLFTLCISFGFEVPYGLHIFRISKQTSGQMVVLRTDERRPINRLNSNSGVSLTKLNVIINLLLTVKLFSALFNLECARIICDPSINVGM